MTRRSGGNYICIYGIAGSAGLNTSRHKIGSNPVQKV